MPSQARTLLRGICLAAFVFFLTNLIGCGESSTEPVDGVSLQYDAGPLSAPFLAAGTHQAAVRFTDAEIGDLAGREILQIQFFIVERPENCTIRIYGQGTDSTPGTQLYSANLGDNVDEGDWNYHTLNQSLQLSSDDIWISVEFSHSDRKATFGCDPGPAVMDGDWLYSNSDQQWLPLSQRTTTSINWNLRAIVAGE